MKSATIHFVLMVASLSAVGCSTSVGQHFEEHQEGHHEGHGTIVATSPAVRNIILTEMYVCQIHSCRHIEVCALERGYLEKIQVKEGQAVKKGDLLFKIVSTLYQAQLDTELAEARLAQIEFTNTKKLFENHVVSDQEVALAQAKLAKALAQVNLAQAELNFTEIKAPFDGIIDRLHEQQGSLVEEGDVLTSLSDNSTMWVYFNVPEARYLEYRSGENPAQADDDSSEVDDDDEDDDDDDEEDDDGEYGDGEDEKDDDEPDEPGPSVNAMAIELVLANGATFPQLGRIGAIEADFNNETGNIAFRADFPNPSGLLRHGQTGSILIHRTVPDALVIPQRATFEILAKQYVMVIGTDHAVHQREINVAHELEDVYVVSKGLQEGDTIVFEGVRQVHDGDTVEFDFLPPEKVLSDLKLEAE